MPKPSDEFQAIFGRLRGILHSHSGNLIVSSDKSHYYCLNVHSSPRFKKSFPIAWVKISKSYVSYHFMPIYFSPALRETLSGDLKARMQGKSCFNFKKPDDSLFRELDRLTERGLEMSRKSGVF